MTSEPKPFVYVLVSIKDRRRHYVGLTSDVRKRLATHNDAGTTFTARFRPWKLLAAVEFGNEAAAAQFEQYLKTGSGRAFAKRHFTG